MLMELTLQSEALLKTVDPAIVEVQANNAM